METTLSHIIRTFNRFELKYILDLRQAARFKTELQAYMLPDEHGGAGGCYEISNLYYDSPALRCYWEKESGVRVRRKLRLRHYDASTLLTEDAPVFIEIKQRVDRVTQKRRALLPYRQALRLCNDRQMPAFDPQDKTVIEEVYAFLWQYNLRPVTLVRYQRQAWIGTAYDIGLRVTFDTQLSCQAHSLHLHETFSGRPMLAANLVVMEIKINERLPIWLSELIAKHNFQLDRVSKYCLSIDAAAVTSAAQRRLLPAESASDILASTYAIYTPTQSFARVKRKE